MVTPFERFTIYNVSRKLNQINLKVSLSHQRPFPNLHFLSEYRFKKRFVDILLDGSIRGGYDKMIISLIDFSLLTSPSFAPLLLTATPFGPPCYDPPKPLPHRFVRSGKDGKRTNLHPSPTSTYISALSQTSKPGANHSLD